MTDGQTNGTVTMADRSAIAISESLKLLLLSSSSLSIIHYYYSLLLFKFFFINFVYITIHPTSVQHK